MASNLNIRTLREVWQESNEATWLPIRGFSMHPLLREGDWILVSHELSGVQRGDILVFQREERSDELVAHRVVSINRAHAGDLVYRTKGDNSTTFDAPFSVTDILGVVKAIQRDGKVHDLSRIGWRLLNSWLATFHLFLGILFLFLRTTKHQLQVIFNTR